MAGWLPGGTSAGGPKTVLHRPEEPARVIIEVAASPAGRADAAAPPRGGPEHRRARSARSQPAAQEDRRVVGAAGQGSSAQIQRSTGWDGRRHEQRGRRSRRFNDDQDRRQPADARISPGPQTMPAQAAAAPPSPNDQ